MRHWYLMDMKTFTWVEVMMIMVLIIIFCVG